jgi:hypothetical protein
MLKMDQPPNGWRYRLVGGTRERHFAGTHFKPRKELENAQTPTSRVHAVLGSFSSEQDSMPEKRASTTSWNICENQFFENNNTQLYILGQTFFIFARFCHFAIVSSCNVNYSVCPYHLFSRPSSTAS